MSKPAWEAGIPANLEAAAEDAIALLWLVENLNRTGACQFSLPTTLPKLRVCRDSLRKFLDEAAKDPT